MGSIISSCRWWRQLTNTMHRQRMHKEPEPEVLYNFTFLLLNTTTDRITYSLPHLPSNHLLFVFFLYSFHDVHAHKRYWKKLLYLGVVKPVPLESFNDWSNAWSLRNWTFSYVFGPPTIIRAQRHCPVLGLSDATDNNYLWDSSTKPPLLSETALTKLL